MSSNWGPLLLAGNQEQVNTSERLLGTVFLKAKSHTDHNYITIKCIRVTLQHLFWQNTVVISGTT